MTGGWLRALRTRQDGSAAVEFAVAAPVLLLAMSGVFDLGAFMHAHTSVRHALGQAARTARANPNATLDQLQTVARDTAAGIDDAALSVHHLCRATAPTQNNARYVQVGVTYNYQSSFPLLADRSFAIVETRRVYVPNLEGWTAGGCA